MQRIAPLALRPGFSGPRRLGLLRKTNAAKKIWVARIGAKRIEERIPELADGSCVVLFIEIFEASKSFVFFSEPGINEGNIHFRLQLLHGRLLQFLNYLQCLSSSSRHRVGVSQRTEE